MLKRIVVHAAVISLALGLVACSSGAGDEAGKPTSSSSASAGVLHLATPAPFNILDPHRQSAIGDSMFTTLIFDRLVMVDAKDELQPMLAESWEYAADGSYLEFSLRTDVTFHDGTPFNAEAVKVNIERAKTVEGSTVAQYLTSVSAVEVVDDYTVRMLLEEGKGAEVPAALTTSAGMMISPTAIADSSIDLASATGPIGSGPYVVSAFTPSEKMTYEAAPAYWDPAAGNLDGIQVEFAANASTRLNQVRTGSSNFAAVSSANEVLEAMALADKGEIGLETVKYRSVMGLMLNSAMGDMQQLEARQAVAYAIDPQMINDLFSGTCEAHRQIYPDANWSAIQDWEYPYEYNPEKAKKMVDELGGVSLSLTFPVGSNTEAPANVLQMALSEVGIDAQLNPVPVTESNTRYMAGDFESLVTASFAPQPDPAATVDLYLTGGFQLARTPAEKDRIYEIAGDGLNPTMTSDERAAVYQEVWETALDEAWFVPVCNITAGIVHTADVGNVNNLPWASQGLQDLRYVTLD